MKWYKRWIFKTETIPKAKDIIELTIKPQLEKKVLNPRQILKFQVAHLDTYFQKWMGGATNEYGVAYWLNDVMKLNQRETNKILNHYPNLKLKINDLHTSLLGYDALMSQLLTRLERYMEESNKDKAEGDRLSWIDLESWIYKTFDIGDDYRRYRQHVIDWNNDIEIDEENITKMVNLINEKSKEAIKKCNDLINLKRGKWKNK